MEYVEGFASKGWIMAVNLQWNRWQWVSLPSNSVLHFGDFRGFFCLFVCFYTHKKMVDFIYFCIVWHFLFMGNLYGLFLSSRAVSGEAVWFTSSHGEKAIPAAAPTARAMQGNHLAPPVTSCHLLSPPAPLHSQSPLRNPVTNTPLCTHRCDIFAFRQLRHTRQLLFLFKLCF